MFFRRPSFTIQPPPLLSPSFCRLPSFYLCLFFCPSSAIQPSPLPFHLCLCRLPCFHPHLFRRPSSPLLLLPPPFHLLLFRLIRFRLCLFRRPSSPLPPRPFLRRSSPVSPCTAFQTSSAPSLLFFFFVANPSFSSSWQRRKRKKQFDLDGIKPNCMRAQGCLCGPFPRTPLPVLRPPSTAPRKPRPPQPPPRPPFPAWRLWS